MPNPAPLVGVHCTYEDCPRTFRTIKDMKAHKTKDPEHDYCSKCDKDFEDEMRLLIHKLSLSKAGRNDHIACPICGIDFKSRGGCEMHIRQVRSTI